MLLDSESVVIKPGAARAQIDADEPEGVPPEPPARDSDEHEDTDGEDPTPTVTRFYGVASLDPQRVSRDADQIAAEIVTHLVGLVGANVDVKLEITAEAPDGVPDDVVRTVTENASTLKLEQHGFESK